MGPADLLIAAAGLAAGAGLTAWIGSARVKRPERARKALVETLESSSARLREAEEERRRTSAVLESMTEGVVVVDTDEKVLLVNPALARTLGASRETLEGRYFWEVFRDAGVNAMIERVLEERAPARREHALLLSGSTFEIRIAPVKTGDSFLGAVAIFYDVTQIKGLERARTEFVANVSHELKTPLTSILGFVETLKEGAVNDPENRDRFLAIIDTHARKLHRLIEDLLYLSGVESGARELAPETLDLGRIVREVLASFEKALRDRNVRAVFAGDPEPFELVADPQALEEILSVLVDNAVKYNVPGGQIDLRARADGPWARIEVADTGIGIPEADLPRVFERFYRVDKSRSRESGGSGLGLSIAKHLVERHGGRIEVRSNEPRGSRFTVLLPAGGPPAP